MYNSSFSARSLMYVFNKNDYKAFELKNIDEVNRKLVGAELAAENILTGLKLKKAHTNGRDIFIPSDYESEILLRKLNANLKYFSTSIASSRDNIIKTLKEILIEGVEYNVARYDIKRFYDSVNINKVINTANIELSSSYETKRLIKKFLINHHHNHGGGLPTGLSLSATLSEIYLNEFDKVMRSFSWVRYYARYVDDIIIITSPEVTQAIIEGSLIEALPSELSLNEGVGKRDFKSLTAKKSTDQWEADFDYLGYNFQIGYIKAKSNPNKTLNARIVNVNISDKKIKLRKSRFISVVRQYLRDGNYEDFRNRFRLLNSGYVYFDKKKSCFRLAGIIYTYSHIDFPSNSLNSLEKFYKNIISGHKGNLCSRLRLSPLSRSERRYFLGQSLDRNFQNRVHVLLPSKEIARLVECWKYV